MEPPRAKLFYTSSSSSSAADDIVISTQAAAASLYLGLPVSVSPSLKPHLHLPHLGWPMITTSVADKPLSAGGYHRLQVNYKRKFLQKIS